MSIIEIGLYALIIAGLVLIGLYFSRGVEEHKNKLKLEKLKADAKKYMKVYADFAMLNATRSYTLAASMLYFDSYSGRYFLADPSVIEQQIRKINEQLRTEPTTCEQFLQLL